MRPLSIIPIMALAFNLSLSSGLWASEKSIRCGELAIRATIRWFSDDDESTKAAAAIAQLPDSTLLSMYDLQKAINAYGYMSTFSSTLPDFSKLSRLGEDVVVIVQLGREKINDHDDHFEVVADYDTITGRVVILDRDWPAMRFRLGSIKQKFTGNCLIVGRTQPALVAAMGAAVDLGSPGSRISGIFWASGGILMITAFLVFLRHHLSSRRIELQTKVMSRCLCFAAITVFLNSTARATGPSLFIGERQRSFDFGRIGVGELAQHEFNITNRGTSDLVISRAETSCGCTGANIVNSRIAPGEIGRVIVGLKSQTQPIIKNEVVTLVTNDPSHPFFMLGISVDVEADISYDMAQFDLKTPQSASEERVITLESLTDAMVDVKEVHVSDARFLSTFIQHEFDYAGRPIVKVHAVWRAGHKVGPIDEKLELITSSHLSPRVVIPVIGVITPDIRASPNAIYFGIAKIGQRMEEKLEVELLKPEVGHLPKIVLTATRPDDQLRWELIQTPSDSLVILRVVLTPKSIGNYNNSLTITVNGDRQLAISVQVGAYVLNDTHKDSN